jgi:hypothetical protein
VLGLGVLVATVVGAVAGAGTGIAPVVDLAGIVLATIVDIGLFLVAFRICVSDEIRLAEL